MAPGFLLPLGKGATPTAPTPIRRYAVPTHHNSPCYAPADPRLTFVHPLMANPWDSPASVH